MVDKERYPLLAKVGDPKDIRQMEIAELRDLSGEIRDYLVEVVSEVGGHFGSGLGAVELSVALHKVFNTPEDNIVWDTGHQAYPHKILTGRKDRMKTIRKLDGLSGFLKRSESPYDAFGAGHATTSISGALGMALGQAYQGLRNKTVAVIGDGAMTGGMAYEAMNNAGYHKADLVVVLNDNQQSIDDNVWQLSEFFTGLTTYPEYNKFRGYVWELTGRLDSFGDRIRQIAGRLEEGIKAVVTPGVLFEALGFKYFGPVNGHNMHQLVKVFEMVRKYREPILVHVVSTKGKGYEPAERDHLKLHGATPFDKMTGKARSTGAKAPSYTKVFGKALVEIVEENKSVVGITAAMPDGTGLNYLKDSHPDNYYDVGIAEEHALTFAAGMATQGVVPVVAIYSTFLQRAFDQIIHDAALQDLHIVLALDRAGLVGADGPTHHGTFDLSYLRMIPNMVIMAPKDEIELRNMLHTAVEYKKGPIALRYPRGAATGQPIPAEFETLPIGVGETIREGSDVALVAVGKMVEYARLAANMLINDNVDVGVYNMRFVKPLDEKTLDEIAANYDRVVTLEDNSVVGGFGSGVLEYFADRGYKHDFLRVGLPDRFVEHGTQDELFERLEMHPEGIARRVREFCGVKKTSRRAAN